MDGTPPPSDFVYIRCPVPAREVEVNWLRRPSDCRCGAREGCMSASHERCRSRTTLHTCNYLCPCFQSPSLYPRFDPRLEDAYGKLVPQALCHNVYDELLLPKLQLYKTEEYDWGVRALEPIQENQIVAIYAAAILPPTAPASLEYSYGTTDDNKGGASEHFLEGLKLGGIARFFNHSCEEGRTLNPCFFEPPHSDKKKEPLIVFKAKRQIMPGEELTFFYSEKAFGADCLCKKCRPNRGDAAGAQHGQAQQQQRQEPREQQGQGQGGEAEA